MHPTNVRSMKPNSGCAPYTKSRPIHNFKGLNKGCVLCKMRPIYKTREITVIPGYTCIWHIIISSTVILAADWSIAVGYWTQMFMQRVAPPKVKRQQMLLIEPQNSKFITLGKLDCETGDAIKLTTCKGVLI